MLKRRLVVLLTGTKNDQGVTNSTVRSFGTKAQLDGMVSKHRRFANGFPRIGALEATAGQQAKAQRCTKD